MIQRNNYLQKLIDRMDNGMIKIITGIRRCGKSYLLFEIFYKYLIEHETDRNHIIKIQLDDRLNIKYRDPDYLCNYVHNYIVDNKKYFILLDEIQYVKDFESVLNSFLHIKNADVYVTGSNAKFLSKDVITEFRGRGDEIYLSPLSFKEFFDYSNLNFEEAYKEYSMYGGMPFLFSCKNDEQKINYLTNLFTETYLKDIVNRNKIRNTDVLEDLLNFVSSSIGLLINQNKLSNSFKTIKNSIVAPNTIKQYLDYCIDSFLIKKAFRYDVKGEKYLDTPSKYYFTDIGLRNARLGFRQLDEGYIMENIIYNELIIRRYEVDVGIITVSEKNIKNNYVRKQLEVDFVCNLGYERYYIQSSLSIEDKQKREKEEKPFLKIDDSFKKIIIVKNNIIKWKDEKGTLILGLKEFLLNPDSIKS